jgi:hypothetical protein
MIENIRKYKGLIFLGIVLVILALVVGIKDELFRGGASGQPVLKISGRTYSDKEFNKLGSGGFQLASSLGGYQDNALLQFRIGLGAFSDSAGDPEEKFFIGRMLLRQAKDEFGVHPGEEEISNYIRQISVFTGEDGEFSEETYRNFIEKGIGRLGMTESDLRELASDVLAYQKINELIGSGLAVNRDVASQKLALDNQRIDGEVASLSIDSFKAAINPTDEEIKTYWETIQDSFTTEPLRKFTYIIATPDMPADLADDEPEAPETLADAAATDEAKQAAAKKKEEEKAKKAAELAETRRKKQIEIDAKVDDFTFRLEEQKGVGFEELAAENGWEVKTSELFPRSKPPAELDFVLRSTSRAGKAADQLFLIEETSDPISKLSPPIAIGENQWLVARLDGEEKSRPKTFEEAQEEARAQFISEKATEALKKAADEAHAKIKEALAAGKSFADAAKEAGIEETSSFTGADTAYRPDPLNEPTNLFEATRNIDPGATTEVIVDENKAFIVYVGKREVIKEADATARIDGEIDNLAARNRITAFTAWLAERTEEAKVERLNRR